MCRSMVDIQCAIAEIRRGKKKEEETGAKYNVRICYAGVAITMYALIMRR